MALEALAVGCAVVVVDGRGLAGLVTSSVVDEWRRNNFGLRLLTREPTKEAIVSEIGRYDAHDAALVSGRIREFASLSTYLDRVEAVYRDVLATPQVLADAPADLRALGRFIAQWLRRLGEGMIPENFDNLLAANKLRASIEPFLKTTPRSGHKTPRSRHNWNACTRGRTHSSAKLQCCGISLDRRSS
jgi:hypothetical protein